MYIFFVSDYYAQGKPCYTEVKFPTLEETIKIINDNGGVVVLAHPGNNLKDKFEIFDEIVKVGVQGVEAFSSYHSYETNNYFYNKAKELNVLYTCGSDYHGKTKPSIVVNGTGCTIDESVIEEELKNYKLI